MLSGPSSTYSAFDGLRRAGWRGGSCEDRDIAFTHGLYGTGLPGERRLLFRETEHGLEPLAVWLTPAGMPKKLQG